MEHPIVSISAKEEEGIDRLEQQIKELFLQERLLLMTKFILLICVIKQLLKKLKRVFFW